MRVLIASDSVIRTFTFPEDSDIHFRSAAAGMIQITPKALNKHYWFNPDYVVAILPGMGE